MTSKKVLTDHLVQALATGRKRMGYRACIAWIALNDEPSEMDEAVVCGFISTSLVADIFGKNASVVARDVVRVRRKEASSDA